MGGMILNSCDYYTPSIPLILIRLFMPIWNYFLLVIYFSNHGSLYCPPSINSEAQEEASNRISLQMSTRNTPKPRWVSNAAGSQTHLLLLLILSQGGFAMQRKVC